MHFNGLNEAGWFHENNISNESIFNVGVVTVSNKIRVKYYVGWMRQTRILKFYLKISIYFKNIFVNS